MSNFNLQHSLSVLSSSKNYKSTGNIHQLPAASTKELIVYVISICRRFSQSTFSPEETFIVPQSTFSPEETFFVPQSYEILRCHPKTTEAEIMLFLQRIVHFPRNYIVIEVNVLPSLLQEVKIHVKYSSEIPLIIFALGTTSEVPRTASEDDRELFRSAFHSNITFYILWSSAC